MFKIDEREDINRDIFKCVYVRYSSSEKSTINTANSDIYIRIPRLLDLNFDVFHAANLDNRYADDDDMRLFNLGPIALFSKYKLTSSNGKDIEDIDHAHIACLMYKLITSSKYNDDLSIGFDRDPDRKQRELSNNKNIKGKHHVRIMLRDIFGNEQHQQKATYGPG